MTISYLNIYLSITISTLLFKQQFDSTTLTTNSQITIRDYYYLISDDENENMQIINNFDPNTTCFSGLKLQNF